MILFLQISVNVVCIAIVYINSVYDTNLYFLDNWKCDQMKWRHNGKKELKTVPVITKTYYFFVSADGKEDGFNRLVYTLLGSNNHTVVIHYTGDESIAKSTTPHVHTLPSIMRQLECSEATPSVAYKRMVATSGPSQDRVAVQLPKNQKQVKNLQAR